MKKRLFSLFLSTVLLLGLLPATAGAAGWPDSNGIRFNYSDLGYIDVTMPTTDGFYTYGTCTGGTASETAANRNTLPASGWNWAVQKHAADANGVMYTMTLNDFKLNYTGTQDGFMFMFHLNLLLKGDNEIIALGPNATFDSDFSGTNNTALSGYWDCDLYISGDGKLTVKSDNRSIGVMSSTFISSGTVISEAKYFLVDAFPTYYSWRTDANDTFQNNIALGGQSNYNSANHSSYVEIVSKQPTIHTVTFDSNGHGTAPAPQQVLTGGKAAEPIAPTAAGYAFGGWYQESACATKVDFSVYTITQDTTLYAKWVEICNLTYDANGGVGTVAYPYPQNSAVTVHNGSGFTNPGHTFGGWNSKADGTGDSYPAGSTYTITADTTFYAMWTSDATVIPPVPPIPPVLPSFPVLPVYTPSYDISIDSQGSGHVTGLPAHSGAGSMITLTVTPEANSVLSQLSVTSSDGSCVLLINRGGGRYSFHMPDDNISITVRFACNGAEDCPSARFPDLDRSEWYHEYVDYMIDHELMGDAGHSLFLPDGTTSRAMIWAILARQDGATVSGVQWDSQARQWAINTGISDGTNGSTAISRQDLAAMLWRCAQHMGGDISVGENTNILSWPDALDISEYAIAPMQWAVGTGIIAGKDGLLQPLTNATRAEAAAMLTRFFNTIEK